MWSLCIKTALDLFSSSVLVSPLHSTRVGVSGWQAAPSRLQSYIRPHIGEGSLTGAIMESARILDQRLQCQPGSALSVSRFFVVKTQLLRIDD